ncbi:Crp/Fnr family transcriptional regulator [Allomuricauda sp. R78024]|uniref:Crp/Fnr family transcriptional regulator n=1 Tax=Allomuricauda sp. R78024 TaxID=3093867 RepID=UPI0037C7BBEC
MKTSFLVDCFPNLEKELVAEIEQYSSIKNFEVKEYIVKEGEFIRSLPIVLDGSIRVYSTEDTMQFLLYYISSGVSCIYSFAHTFNNEPAEFSAITEVKSTLMLLPLERVRLWLKKYPSFASIVLNDYQKHYTDLLHTTKQVICYNLEDRLIDYLKTKAEIEKSTLLKISHQEIADNLGTSREVITRVLKKLGKNQKVEQMGRKIKVL